MKRIIELYFWITLIGSVLFFMWAEPSTWYSKEVIRGVCNLSIVSVILFFIWDKKNRKKFGIFRSGIIFLLSFVIVHFQLNYDTLYFSVSHENIHLFSINVINKAAILSYIGLESFLCGYSVVSLTDNKIPLGKSTFKQFVFNISYLKIPLVLFLVLFLYYGKGFIFSMKYGTVDTTASAYEYVNILFKILLYSYLILSALNYRNHIIENNWYSYLKYVGFTVNIIIIVYVIAILSTGDRGPAIVTIIAYLISGQIATKKKLSILSFLIIIVTAGVITSILGIVRSAHTMENIDNMVVDAYDQVRNEDSFSPITLELANSVKTLHYSVQYVPNKINYTNGVFQISYIIQSVPFLGTQINKYAFNDVRFTRSTAFITWLIQGDNPTSGAGTSCIADAYIDFGVTGVIIILFLFGILSRKSDSLFTNRISTLSAFKLSVYFIIACTSYYFPRSAFLFHFKEAFWLFMIISILIYLTRKKLWIRKALHV